LALRQARLIVGLGSILAVGMVIYTLRQPRMYTTTTSFLLQASRGGMSSGMPSIAAQLGVALPSADPGQSPPFYTEMVKSRSILSALVDSTFEYRTPSGATMRTTLADAYDVPRRPPAERRDDTIERLANAITVRTSQKSGVITYTLQAPAPELSRLMAEALLAQLVRFNMQRRQTQAAAERKFTERRLADVGAELRIAEGQLETFLRENRSMVNSPQLTFQQQRLQREVELRRTLYVTLSQSYEQSKIEEVRDTPQITTIEAPELPSRPDSRLLVGKALAAGVFGGLLGLLIGFARERFGDARRSSDDEVAEFLRLRQATMERLRRPFRSGPKRPSPR
jgi:uncharacterized protein involved in exopolysaccharide biosynthesis